MRITLFPRSLQAGNIYTKGKGILDSVLQCFNCSYTGFLCWSKSRTPCSQQFYSTFQWVKVIEWGRRDSPSKLHQKCTWLINTANFSGSRKSSHRWRSLSKISERVRKCFKHPGGWPYFKVCFPAMERQLNFALSFETGFLRWWKQEII